MQQGRRADPLVLSQSIATIIGQQYQVSFWTKGGSDVNGGDTLDVTFGGVPIFSQVSGPLSPTRYLEHSFTLLAALGSTDLVFSARSHSIGVTWMMSL